MSNVMTESRLGSVSGCRRDEVGCGPLRPYVSVAANGLTGSARTTGAIIPLALELRSPRCCKNSRPIISIDYRLAPQAKLQQIIQDLQDAYQWVRADGPKLFRIDPNRIAVVGHSAGG